MTTTIALTSGKQINDWTLIERDSSKNPGVHWVCECKCGIKKSKHISKLLKGLSPRCRSCATKKYPRPFGLKASINIQGEKFGKWSVLERVDNKFNKTYFKCKCDCGFIKDISGSSLRRGDTKCCKGCSNRDKPGTHGYCKGGKTPEYHIWRNIKDRCLNPRSKGYKNYGGRGISICDRWKDSFESFIEDVGKKPFEDASIDRVDNEGNYEPGNVRWTDRKTQTGNTRRQKYGFCVIQWCRENNLDRFHVSAALKKGISKEDIKKTVKKTFTEYEKKRTPSEVKRNSK